MIRPVHVIALLSAALVAYSLHRHFADDGTVPAPRAPGEQPATARYERYSLREVAEMGAPRAVYFQLLRDFALKECWAPRADVPQNGDECRASIEQRHAGCVERLAPQVPETVRGRDTAAALDRHYLECVNPTRYGEAVGPQGA